MVDWYRSDEGHINSKCGRFSISPEYFSCVRPQSYTLEDKQTGKKQRSLDTQMDCKIKAEQWEGDAG